MLYIQWLTWADIYKDTYNTDTGKVICRCNTYNLSDITILTIMDS